MSKVLIFNIIIRYLIISTTFSYISSEQNNARYLVPSYFLTYPKAISKIIRKGFAPYGVSHTTPKIKKKFLMIFNLMN